jgi:GT2 family glycosyltransferase
MADYSQVAIITVSYKSAEDLPPYFKSLAGFLKGKGRIIIVDNDSPDTSVEIAKKYAGVEVLAQKENVGFAGANNVGIEHAFKTGAEYVFLLNPDTEVDEKCMDILLEASKHHKDTILQPLLLVSRDGIRTKEVNSWGNPMNYLGVSYAGGFTQTDWPKEAHEIPVASGACLWFPKSIYDTIGALDANLFLYCEEQDFCWRALIAGFSSWLIPEALVWHRYEFSRNARKFFFYERNRWLFLLKNFQVHTLILLAIPLCIHEVLMVVYGLKAGFFKYKLEAIGAVFMSLPRVIRERKDIAAIRVRSDRQIKRLLTPDLDFAGMKVPLQGVYSAWLKGYWKAVSWLI